MKKWLLLFSILLLFFSCKKTDSIIGMWKVKDAFYQATYEILENDDGFYALIHHYNDGTTVYNFDGIQKHYFFTKLKKQGDLYIDGISGATKSKKKKEKNKFTISLKSKDTLEVKTYIHDQPITETWTR
jgi:hypothetical protein